MAVLEKVWPRPRISYTFLLTIPQPMDLTCVETQIGDGGKLDCEIVDLDTVGLMYRVNLPTH